MRRLITLLVAAAVALLGAAFTAGTAAAQETPDTRTLVLFASVMEEFDAHGVTVAAADGAIRHDVDGQVSLEFPVTGDPTDGVVELGGSLQLSNAAQTLGISEIVVDTTTGTVSGAVGGRLDLFTVAPTDVEGTWVVALNGLAAFGININFGTTFEAGEPFGTVAL